MLSTKLLSLVPQPTLLNALLAVLSYIALRALYQIIKYRLLHPLRTFPGPFWGSVTRLWVGYHNLKQDELELELALHRKHGKIIRITPTLLMVSDPTALPLIYHRSADKSQHYITGSFGKVETLFNMQPHREHAHFRKYAAGPYSFSNIKKMEPNIDAGIAGWALKLDKFAASGERFDFALWSTFFAYDVISDIGFGAPFGFVESESDVGGLIQGIHDGMPVFGLLARLYPFTNALKNTWIGERFLVAKSSDNSGIGVLMRFRDKLFAARKEAIKAGTVGDRVDLLQTFLNARTEEGDPLSDEWIKAEILLVLLAGADTTGTAFAAMMFYLQQAPEVYERMVAEIDAASRAGQLSAVPQYDEVVAHLPYYIAVVKEAMRLCPSAPNIFPRLVGKGGVQIDGRFIPEGTEVTCNPWILGRDKGLYGEDAEVFRPERWLEDEERRKRFEKYSMVFGYGSRVCLGKDIAHMELFKGPVHFFRSFKPLMAGERPGRLVVAGGVGYFADQWMRLEKRTLA
ncbi:flavonoid 3',5'-hydroxylase [Trichodelitschia bisporula]|uniref:Flavonoid 3',5'-hydroxylase n=1 Tax=Trichodelitschia bisporula TaxID=703511 RepID=A0A6G1HJL3_9PEZI|nr:flavonoid 3',5'-hydroxylase [Trichodelitschia bisporula]